MTKGGKRRKTRRKGLGGLEERVGRDGGALTIRAGTLPGSTRTHSLTCGTATPLQTGAVGQAGMREREREERRN